MLLIALPIVAMADPISTALFIVKIASDLAIAGIISAASYGIGKLAQAIGPKAKPTELGRQDVRISTSREGENMRRPFGKFAFGGQIISGGQATENRAPDSGSGKRRTPGQVYYSMSIAVVACENIDDNILGVSRVWMDNKVVYEVDPVTLAGTNPSVLGYLNGPQSIAGGARRFQILLGQEDQTDRCDWHVLYAGQGNEDNVPGYRGYVTLWWDDLDLRPYYNRPPQILVEVVCADGTIREIITALCAQSGIDTDTEIDVTGITSSYDITGMFSDGPTPAKQLLEAMAIHTRFAGVEADGQLKFFDLPTESSATIADGDMGAFLGGIEDNAQRPPKFALSMEQTQELPMRVDVAYFDADDTYQQAVRGYSRQVGDAKGTQQLYLPMAITGTRAKSIASRTVTSAHAEGDPVKLFLPPAYIEYHPGDELTAPASDGTEIDVQISRMSFEPGGVIEIEGIRQIRLTGAGTPNDDPGSEPEPFDEQSLLNTYVLSNVPPLIDDHDGTAGIYFAAVPQAQPGDSERPWTGAILIRNACGSDETYKQYEAIGRTGTPATIGKAMTALDDGSGLDTLNEVDVYLAWGGGNVAVAGILDDAFTKTTTANLCILGKEVLQFRDVVDVSGSYGHDPDSGFVYRLSHLKRGLRSTSHLTDTHVEDEAFVMWSPDSVIRIPLNIDEQGPAWSFKALTDGQAEADVDPSFFITAHDGDTLLTESEMA